MRQSENSSPTIPATRFKFPNTENNENMISNTENNENIIYADNAQEVDAVTSPKTELSASVKWNHNPK